MYQQDYEQRKHRLLGIEYFLLCENNSANVSIWRCFCVAWSFSSDAKTVAQDTFVMLLLGNRLLFPDFHLKLDDTLPIAQLLHLRHMQIRACVFQSETL